MTDKQFAEQCSLLQQRIIAVFFMGGFVLSLIMAMFGVNGVMTTLFGINAAIGLSLIIVYLELVQVSCVKGVNWSQQVCTVLGYLVYLFIILQFIFAGIATGLL